MFVSLQLTNLLHFTFKKTTSVLWHACQQQIALHTLPITTSKSNQSDQPSHKKDPSFSSVNIVTKVHTKTHCLLTLHK